MHITVGVPLYRGQDHVAEALKVLQDQTHREFDVVISVDGGDELSAEACRPFLNDSRFRLVVQPNRLDWAGNFNWLLQQPVGDLFCYRQHDDLTTPDFFEKLIARARERPDAAIVYADCQFFGENAHLEATPSYDGDQLDRMREFIDRITPTPCRGLVRKEALLQAGLVRVDEFRSNHQVFVWLLKVLRWGSFLRHPEPIYLRRIHAANYHKQNRDWDDARKLGDWSTVFTGFLEAVQPVCRSNEERLYFQHYILDRVCVPRVGQSYRIRPNSPEQSGAFMSACFERLAKEGLSHLWLAPPTVAEQVFRLKRKNRQLRAQKSLAKSRAIESGRKYHKLRKSRAIRLLLYISRLLGNRTP